MIIVFSGTDGAGKSTQIQHLRSELISSGYKTRSIWARGGYTPGMLTIKKILRKIGKNVIPQAGNSSARDKQFRKKHITYLWLLLSMIDLLLLWAVYARLLSFFGYIVILDRYIDDTSIDFSHNFPTVQIRRMWPWKILENLIPVPHHAFLLIVEPSVSMRRSLEKNEPFPDNEETLKFRYHKYLERNGFIIKNYRKIDTRLTKQETATAIMKYMRETIN